MTTTQSTDTTQELLAGDALSAEVLAQIQDAHALLESTSLAIRLNNAMGKSIDQAADYLPEGWQRRINGAVKFSLDTAMGVAAKSLPSSKSGVASKRLHKLMAGSAGALGGATGLVGIALELPVSVTLMLRSIADIAQAHGEDPSDPETLLACLEVFAMGGTSEADDDAEIGYLAIRSELAWLVSQGVEHLATRALTGQGGTALGSLSAKIAQRFGVSVSQKAMAQAMPIIGAIGGASINLVFVNHFQQMAEGHFSMRSLERECGKQAVWQAYRALQTQTLA